jgi:energy-coupling factor transporter ATP-binding protein EcfA2
MRLVRLELSGYKRFDYARMNVDSEVIAIVGPNEAGKSTILQALRRLNDTNPLSRGEITRGARVDEKHTVITARFLLEKEDIAAISSLHSAMQARWYVRSKSRDGTRYADIVPQLTRDLEPRRRVLKRLVRFEKLNFAKALPRFEDGSGPGDMLDSSIKRLNTADQIFSEETRAVIERLRLALSGFGEDLPATGRSLEAELQHLLDHEAEEHPNAQASKILQRRRPEFLLFGEEDRTLLSDYDLTSDAANPPPALRNLADLADLDLSKLLVLQP